MLEAVELPASITGLDTGLADVDRKTFTHVEEVERWLKEDKKFTIRCSSKTEEARDKEENASNSFHSILRNLESTKSAPGFFRYWFMSDMSNNLTYCQKLDYIHNHYLL